MKKVAYLIVVHTDPEILEKLITALNFNADYFIHVDKKVDDEPFKKALAFFNNVFFVENRHWVQWGGFSIVEAQLELQRQALNRSSEYSRLVHLSGLDYPIVNNVSLHYIFSKAEVEYISGFNITMSQYDQHKDRVRYYHLFRDTKIRLPFLQRLISYTFRTISRVLYLKKDMTVNINGKAADVFFGSHFIAITPVFAKYLLQTYETNPELVKYFKSSYTPDELFIHTVFFNSSFATNAYTNPKDTKCDLENLAPLHYFEYSSEINVFTVDDYNKIVSLNKSFIRKVTIKKSLELVRKIDAFRKSQMSNLT